MAFKIVREEPLIQDLGLMPPLFAIEVKGRAGRGPVQLTENEWPTAVNVRDRYRLYVVVDCATNPILYRVQDPAFKLAVKSRQSFTINFGDILREAEPD